MQSRNNSRQPLLDADSYEINYSDLTLYEILGEGAFGKVVRADLHHHKEKGKDVGKSTVAVKMLKGKNIM